MHLGLAPRCIPTGMRMTCSLCVTWSHQESLTSHCKHWAEAEPLADRSPHLHREQRSLGLTVNLI